MERVVPVEEVRGRRVTVRLRVLGQVGREEEVETGASARRRSEVLGLVVVLILVRMSVVAPCDHPLGPCDAVVVVPTERRRERVRRVGHDRERSVVRALRRDLEHAVARPVVDGVGRAGRREHRRRGGAAGARQRCLQVPYVVLAGPVVDSEESARRRVDGRVPEGRAGRVVDRELPREAKAVLRGGPAQPGWDRDIRDPTARDDGLVVASLEHAEVGGLRQVECPRGRVDGLDGVERRGRGTGGAQVAHESAGGEDDAAVLHADGRVAPEDLEVLEALVEVDVGDA